MPQGIQIFNGGGALIVDESDRIGMFLGRVSTGTTAGSITVAEFATRTPLIATSFAFTGGTPPTITISGTTLSWSWGGPSQQWVAATIIYGVW